MDMFDLLWSQRDIWLNAHVSYILPQIIEHWPEIIQNFLEKRSTKDLFINVDLEAKKTWIHQLTTKCEGATEDTLTMI